MSSRLLLLASRAQAASISSSRAISWSRTLLTLLSVLHQTQDLAVEQQLLRRRGRARARAHLQGPPLGAVVGEQQEERLRVALALDVLLQAGQAGLDQRVLAGGVQLHAAAEHHGDVLLVELGQATL